MHIYVMLLEKFDSLHKGCYEKDVGADVLDSWITLGHFDAMRVYKLERNENLFEAVSWNNQELALLDGPYSHSHPLFLLSIWDDASFWKEKQTNYIAVARIHFSSSVNANESYKGLEKELAAHARSLRKHTTQWDCDYRIYRTIELSDMILAVKSDWMLNVLLFTLTLQRYHEVGKVYTYCGIRYGCVRDLTWQPDENDRIPLLSMRFSIADCGYAMKTVEQAIKLLGQDKGYSVMGVDDIVVDCRELPVRNLVSLYREWFVGSPVTRDDLMDAFAEITARAGISLLEEDWQVDDPGQPEENPNLRLKMLCGQLLEELPSLQSKLQNTAELSSLLHPLLKLTAVLVRMSKTPLLDEFVYLMLPAVRSFMENMGDRFNELSDEDIERCNYFMESWGNLMEHIMRIEGQLAHHPEMRPALYDMPAAMLEYTLAFLYQTAGILQSNDAQKTQIHFLLIPRLCKRIKAQELFPAEPGGRLGLILLTVPYRLFHKPHEMQSELCHEVSHFVGETPRLREERRKKYIQSAAVLISREFFDSHNPAYVNTIQDCLTEINFVLLSLFCDSACGIFNPERFCNTIFLTLKWVP